ncbi:MAG: sulfatase-like hydrolase/transferase, partial [Verrucomicrobia bacterium]|nr:sulfatase-like hydrolase/transferase [Verrucomicrobiota bacterium]
MKTTRLVSTLVGFMACAALANGGTRPNFLVIISDDQRPDTIHALGNRVIRTPHLDSLVSGGTAFTRATAAYPICVASRAEILTGVCSFRNGVPYGSGKLRLGLAFWADTLRQAGYRTWYVGKWHNDGTPKTRGYEESRGLYTGGGGGKEQMLPRDWADREVTGYRGWTFKTDDGRAEPERGVGLTPDISRRFADAAVELINRRATEPFFLHVNFTAPHDPLIIPPGYAGRYDPQKIPLPPNFLPEHPFDHGNLRGRDEQLWPWPRT